MLIRFKGGDRSQVQWTCRLDLPKRGVTEWATPLSTYLSDPQDEAVTQEGAQNSVKKGCHFGHYRSRVSVHASHEALTLRPGHRVLHLSCRSLTRGFRFSRLSSRCALHH